MTWRRAGAASAPQQAARRPPVKESLHRLAIIRITTD
jgi:hypothetical protein